jgi:putative transcription antitermination factor YqgF
MVLDSNYSLREDASTARPRNRRVIGYCEEYGTCSAADAFTETVSAAGCARRGRSRTETKSVAHNAAHLLRFRDDYAIAGWVLGLPLLKSGDEGPQAKLVREFGQWLEQISQRPVTYWDERLTSHAAEAKLATLGESALWNKGRVDGLAAQIILQAYLDQRPP